MRKTLALVLALLMMASFAATANAAVEEKASAWTPTEDMHYVYWFTSDQDIPSIEAPYENVPGDWLSEKTKVYLDEGFGNGGMAPSAKMQTLIAGGNMPDFGYFYNFEAFGACVEAEQVWGLTPEIIQQYAPNVWSMVPESVWNAISRDGLIYAIPYSIGAANMIDEMRDEYSEAYFTLNDQPWITVSWTTGNPFYIRDDVQKALFGDAYPTYEEAMAKVKENNEPVSELFVHEDIDTTEKFVDVFYQIQKLGLTTVAGKPVYAHGIHDADNWPMLVALGGEMVGYKQMEYMTVYNAGEDKLEFGLETDMVKEAAKLVNQMINDKVIDPECLVHTREVYKEKLLAGQYAITQNMGISGAGMTIDTLNAYLTENNAGYHYVPFYTCVAQQENYPYMRRVASSVGAQYMIPFKTMDENKLYQWLNWINVMYTDEWQMVSEWGIEGETYAIGDDGIPYYLDEGIQNTKVYGTGELDWKECKGLYNYNRPTNYAHSIVPYPNKYGATVLYQGKMAITEYTAFTKFSYSSKYAQNVPLVGNFQSWHADYGALQEVTDMFGTRDIWEDAFKQTMVVSPDEFEAKWAAAFDVLYDCFDVKGLLEHQTPIFQANQEAVKALGREFQ